MEWFCFCFSGAQQGDEEEVPEKVIDKLLEILQGQRMGKFRPATITEAKRVILGAEKKYLGIMVAGHTHFPFR